MPLEVRSAPNVDSVDNEQVNLDKEHHVKVSGHITIKTMTPTVPIVSFEPYVQYIEDLEAGNGVHQGSVSVQVDNDFEDDQDDVPLPSKNPFFVRVWSYPFMSHYRRLVLIAIIINLSVALHGTFNARWWSATYINLDAITVAAMVNTFLAIVIRQRRVINTVFGMSTLIPTNWPVSVRAVLAHVFHLGGIHSGCSVCATLWVCAFVAAGIYGYLNQVVELSLATLIVVCALVLLLLVIIILALPPLRFRFHDYFEHSHRYMGWTSLGLLWAFNILYINDHFTKDQCLGHTLVTSVNFWLQVLITCSIISPWLTLRRISISVDQPSSHAIITNLDYGNNAFPGATMAISRNPLAEWHPFACIPSPGKSGYRLIISRAGDWTGKFIDEPPSHVWIKGVPVAGMAFVQKLFPKVVFVATGSGFGPILPHLLQHAHQEAQKAQQYGRQDKSLSSTGMIWSTRSPRQTYGDTLVTELMNAIPNVTIWNTSEQGRPDLITMAYNMVKKIDAEAVVIIANQKITRKLVYGFKSRNIPAFGAIWDS